MRVSFDLDGVVAEGVGRWFFRFLDTIRKVDGELAELAEMDYYLSRPLKHHPNLFMAQGDVGSIITCRKPKAESVTREWLSKKGIFLPILFADKEGNIDWHLYDKASMIAATYKAEIIHNLNIEVHFDNNPVIIDRLRFSLPEVKFILVGGE